jgi:hypothetical protein
MVGRPADLPRARRAPDVPITAIRRPAAFPPGEVPSTTRAPANPREQDPAAGPLQRADEVRADREQDGGRDRQADAWKVGRARTACEDVLKARPVAGREPLRGECHQHRERQRRDGVGEHEPAPGHERCREGHDGGEGE